MEALALHTLHHGLNARFAELDGLEIVDDYGDAAGEHAALWNTAGVLDFGFRGRVCLTGADRVRFLHGQVTNDVKRLRVGEGCYAALVTAKGRMESDLNLFCLPDELLLDFEPGLTAKITARLERFIVSDDVQVVDAAPHYGLLSVQGPAAESVMHGVDRFAALPGRLLDFVQVSDAQVGETYVMNHARLGSSGYDVFAPSQALAVVAKELIAAANRVGGRVCGWRAFDVARIEAGIPRYGTDMDDSNLPLEAGLESRAVSYSKGCYIGQEVLNRVHSIGQVTKSLRGLRLEDDLKTLPHKGDKLFYAGKETGYVTSAVRSPSCQANLAIGYVRKEVNQLGTELALRGTFGESLARIVALPFRRPNACETGSGDRVSG